MYISNFKYLWVELAGFLSLVRARIAVAKS
jgi:hypothetical protein